MFLVVTYEIEVNLVFPESENGQAFLEHIGNLRSALSLHNTPSWVSNGLFGMKFFVQDPGLEQVGDWWQKMWIVSWKIGLLFDLYSSQVFNLWRIETGIGDWICNKCWIYLLSLLVKQMGMFRCCTSVWHSQWILKLPCEILNVKNYQK